MSRPKKMHEPLGATFTEVLGIIATGSGSEKASPRKPAKKKRRTRPATQKNHKP